MRRFGFFALLGGCLILVGCSSAPVSLDRTPTPDVMVTTIAVLQTQNAQLATQVAGLPATIQNLPTATAVPTQTPLPSPTPTVTSTPTATSSPTRTAMRRPVPTATLPSPQIFSFTVDPREVNPGERVTLRWSTANAARVVIQQHSANNVYGALSLALNGSIVLPIADQERLWQSFEIVAYNAAGNRTSNSVGVVIRCPYTYFFSFPKSEDQTWRCPEGPVINSNAAEQYFESGRMIWLEGEKRIYVLLNDGGLYTYADTWTADQPDSDPGIKPPVGRYQPVRGFGKVWRADPYIRSRLGWAMAREQGYQAQLQHSWTCCNSSSRMSYLREFDNRVSRLWPGESLLGHWEFTLF